VADSILNSIKKTLGIDSSYTAFDPDILMHINTVFSDLNQLGIGPDEGFMIEDASPTWDDYLDGDKNTNNVKTYMFLRVKLLFDNASMTSSVVDAMERQIDKLEWRINVKREGEKWTDPTAPAV